jgi:hypothetical protein
MRDEVFDPGGWVGQLVAEVFTADEGASGVTLPAGRAQTQPGMPTQLAALAADPGRLLGWAWAGARPTPACVVPQIARLATARAGLLGGESLGFAAAVPAESVAGRADRMAALVAYA